MRIRKPGKIRDHLWFLGREESCVYLLEGRDESMIVSGGFSFIVPDLLRQFDEFSIDEDRITKLLILHSHFDHVGIVPFFKRRSPDLTLYASARAWKVLQKQNAINISNQLNEAAAKSTGLYEACSKYDLEWKGEISGLTVSEGDTIDLGGLEVCIFETPGHSSCSVSAYVPELKSLFPSDGGGIPYQEIIIAFGTSNYTQFQQSLEKLTDLEVEYLCSDHYGYIANEEAGGYIKKALKVANDKRDRIQEIYQRRGEVEATVEELVTIYQPENSGGLVPLDVFKGVYRQMVKHIVTG